MDFNGDGRADILVLNDNKTYKVVGVKTFASSPWMDFEIIGEGILDDYKPNKQLLFGDYNGDSKTDIMIPQGDGINPGETYWNIFYSNPKIVAGGTLFEKETMNIAEYWPTSGTYYSLGQSFSNFYALDVNKDGKTDLVKVWRNYYKPQMTINDHDTNWQIITYTNNIGKQNNGGVQFNVDYVTPCQGYGIFQNCDHHDDSPEMPVPIVSTFKYAGLNNEIVMIRKHTNELTYINFTKDFTKDNNLIKVKQSNGAIEDKIEYKSLETDPNVNFGLNASSDFYSSTNTTLYPFTELKQMSTSRLVDKLTNTVMGVERFQNFKYHGFVVNLQGLGIIGFKKIARSSWFNLQTGKKTWVVTENDPSKRGATIRTYSQLLDNSATFSFADESNKLSQIENEFTQTTNVQQYVMLLKKQTTHDFLTNVVTTAETEYTADYLLPKKTINKNFVGTALHGTSTSETTFDVNTAGTGSNYYIGRPLSTKSTVSAYNDTKLSTETYFYTNGNITKTEKNANNASETIVETADYYATGNLKSKTIRAVGTAEANALAPRTTSYTYDATNRFIKSITDVEGLTAVNDAFHPLYGVVLQQTNPLVYLQKVFMTTGVNASALLIF